MKSTGETTNTTEKEQKLPVTEKNGTAPEKTEHILNRLIIGAGVCVAVIAVLIGVKLYRQDRQMDITEPFARSMVLASDPLSAEKRFQAETLSADLCVGETSVPLNDISFSSQVKAGLFDLDHKKVLFAQNMYDQVYPASITKIMTLLLIFDALDAGKISLEDTVTVSEHAASMGGSQVFLEPGETQDVDTMIKCISIASANDACVAMAEFICGSEAAFVEKMNARAKGLGMNDTTFVNCCGLDVDGHMTSAYDVALMSRELTTKYPQIHNYSTIWMDTITHVTRRGSEEFGLTNTNKLIRQYQYATGLKTGSTSLAKYCVSATAVKDGMELIAVVMAAPDFKIRFADAATLLNYGFSKCRIYSDENTDTLAALPLKKGISDEVSLCYRSPFQYVDTDGSDLSGITKELELPESVEAPVASGDVIGRAVYKLGDRELGTVDILCSEDIAAAVYKDYFMESLQMYLP